MDMDKLVSLCKRRGFLFQSSEIYGGLNGFWDYGPLGVELKRNVKEAWWRDMVTGHDDLGTLPEAPSPYDMVGLDCTIIMHPQVWKCSGHYDLFHDFMVDCRESKKRYRHDQVRGRWVEAKGKKAFVSVFTDSTDLAKEVEARALKFFDLRSKNADQLKYEGDVLSLTAVKEFSQVLGPDAKELGTLTEPREFNLMFKTWVGALGGEESTAFLRPETAQGIFVNFKNVVDSSRVRLPFGIAQVGKSFRNEITPRNFTFRSREFEQMEIEFFCNPKDSPAWYKFWRDRRYDWYLKLGLGRERLRLRDHSIEEVAHYSCGTADIEYAFPFLPPGEFGELEAGRGTGPTSSISEAIRKASSSRTPAAASSSTWAPTASRNIAAAARTCRTSTSRRARSSSRTSSSRAPAPTARRSRFCARRITRTRRPTRTARWRSGTVLKLHPRLAPIKAAIFPLVKKEGMPELAQEIYRSLKPHLNVAYDAGGAVGRRYRRQDEIGTPFCITVDGQSLADKTVTLRDRDTLKQERVPIADVVAEVRRRVTGT